ncbi:hypothetical protein ACTNDY_09295 [Tissierellaceae bacterium HCP3S3_D8]
MCRKVIFHFSTHTFEGHPIIGAGICDIIHGKQVLDISSSIDNISLRVRDLNNSYEIDYLLKEKIAKIFPTYVLGLALSIEVPDAIGPTGGIIGNPFFEGKTANGLSQDIGNGFSVIALPGGPGLLIQGDTGIAKNIFTNIVIGENRLISTEKIVREFKNNEINLAIIVTDGTGIRESGTILSYDNGKIEKLKINGW